MTDETMDMATYYEVKGKNSTSKYSYVYKFKQVNKRQVTQVVKIMKRKRFQKIENVVKKELHILSN